MMEIGKAFSYVFEDPEWIKKVLVGGGILFVGFLFCWLIGIPLLLAGALVFGYTLTVTKNVAEGNPTPLPQWSDMGAMFKKGLFGIIGYIIYFSPVILLSCCVGIVSAGGSSLAGGSSSSSSSTSIAGVIGIVAACLNCLVSLLSLVLSLTAYAPTTRFAMSENQLSLFWDFRGTMDFITKNLSNYIIAVLVAMVAGIVGSLGIILCGIGLPFTIFWSYLVGAFLFGQVWRVSQGQAPMPVAA
jgi:hypothetical protein